MKTTASPDTYRKTKCRYCTGPLAEPFLELGTMPLANSLIDPKKLPAEEFACPLSVTRCPACALVQLTHVVPAEIMFSNYLYVSSTTQTFRDHFAAYAKSVKAKSIAKGPLLAVDIGSNDGLLLSCYEKEGMKAVGIEPAVNLSKAANAAGRTTINRYFDRTSVDQVIKNHGRAHIVSANNVFAHIDDIYSVFENVLSLLDDRGIFVIEFPYLVTMFEKMFFDMIYHEHLSYISLLALDHITKRFGLEMFDVEEVASHGGSLRVFMQKQKAGHPISGAIRRLMDNEVAKGYRQAAVYERFGAQVRQVREDLIGMVSLLKSKSKTISGYGAPAKATTIINYCRFNASQIDFIVDDNPLKQGMLLPGARIPIVPSDTLMSHTPDAVIIFAWNFADEIMRKISPLKNRGVEMIVPLPEPKII